MNVKKFIYFLLFLFVVQSKAMDHYCSPAMVVGGLKCASYVLSVAAILWAGYCAVPLLRDGIFSVINYSYGNNNFQYGFGYNQTGSIATTDSSSHALYIDTIPVTMKLTTQIAASPLKELNMGGKKVLTVDTSNASLSVTSSYIRPIRLPQYRMAIYKSFVSPVLLFCLSYGMHTSANFLT